MISNIEIRKNAQLFSVLRALFLFFHFIRVHFLPNILLLDMVLLPVFNVSYIMYPLSLTVIVYLNNFFFQGLIFVVDSNDRERIQEGADELQKMVMFLKFIVSNDAFFWATVVVLVVDAF